MLLMIVVVYDLTYLSHNFGNCFVGHTKPTWHIRIPSDKVPEHDGKLQLCWQLKFVFLYWCIGP
jgi:hypothetical protein